MATPPPAAVGAFLDAQPKASEYVKKSVGIIAGIALIALSGMFLFKAYQAHGLALSEAPFYAALGGVGAVGLVLTVLSIKGLVGAVNRACEYKRSQAPH